MNDQNGIMNVSVFGSYGRGNSDSSSDLDVIVMCRDAGGTQSIEKISAVVSKHYGNIPSISWYGEKKLRFFFESGDLFAWHLYNESLPLAGYTHLKEVLGKPAPYLDCMEDILGLREILINVPKQILHRPENTIYELGIVFVCLRNIAMAASSKLCGSVQFGRYSPMLLPMVPFPLSMEAYELLAGCRHASTRGLIAPKLNICVENVIVESVKWVDKLIGAIEKTK